MKTEGRFNPGNIRPDFNKEYCNHPLLHPTLNQSGFHTGFYVCVKCEKIIKDTSGTMMTKQLFF